MRPHLTPPVPLLTALLCCLALVSPAAIIAARPLAAISAPHSPDAVLVAYQPGARPALRAGVLAAVNATTSERVSSAPGSPERVQLRRGTSVEEAIKRLGQVPGVAYAEPDYLLTSADAANDPYFSNGSLWGMYGAASSPANTYGSGAATAWAAGHTGSRSVYVAVVDEGIQFNHPDLAANIWTNPFDPVDGVDNDHNGFIDDAHGWDFFNADASVYDGNATAGDDDHGTHVAGTIGALGGNGVGVAGVNWRVTIISAKFMGPNGGYVSGAIRALDYLADLHARHGLNIVATNNSWGGASDDPLLLDAIERAGDAGMLFVAAAGNGSANNDAIDSFPADYRCTKHADGTPRGYDCVISVAAITSSGARAGYTNYGATTVDLGAPGSGIYSTVPVSSYAPYSGTSMAAPHVTGALALCASVGGLTGADLRAALLNSVAPTASLATTTASGGRLDVGAMMAWCSPATQPVSGSPGNLSALALGLRSAGLTWTDGAQNESAYEVQGAPDSAGQCAGFTTLARTVADSTGYQADGLVPGGHYCFRVRAVNTYQGGSASAWSEIARANLPAAPTYACASAAYAWTDAAGLGYAMADDGQVRVNLPNGFGFDFYGESASWLDISANGYLAIGTTNAPTVPWANTTLPNPDQPNGIAAAWWDDLNPNGETHVWTQTLGSAPNRVFVVEWRDLRPYQSGSTSGVGFEVRLEESSAAITFSYRDVIAGLDGFDGGAGATVGVEDQLGTLATQIVYNQPLLANATSYRCATQTVIVPPSSPTGVVATRGDGSATVAWDPPASDGGSPIAGYLVISSPDGETCSTGGVLSCKVTGLANGTQYRFKVVATNAVGASAPSLDSNAVTPAPPQDITPPSAAAPVAALMAGQTIGATTTLSLAWSASSDPSGITAYDLGYTKADGAWTSIGLPSPAATGANVSVVPGSAYAFRLRAHDGAGNIGPWTVSAGVRVDLLQEDSPGVVYVGAFKRSSLSGASGGKVRQAGQSGRIARLTFSGASVGFVTTLGPGRGIAEVWLDGTLRATLDLYSTTSATSRLIWFVDAGAGLHVLEIRPTGTRNPASSAKRVDIDAFVTQQ